ncbi:MAG: plasma-membrane proton-efflux P-type ATPase, partial [Ignavibacteriales bacterium]|nr:plasma-membrane proton-efflux P-type ATPase [Ignavibacteriales bacterium]
MDFPVRSTSEFKNLSLEETYLFLHANSGGLSDVEAQQRLAIQGSNEIVEKQRNYFLEFILRFWGPMPWLLEIACGLSIVLTHYVEGLIIGILLVVNAIIGQ